MNAINAPAAPSAALDTGDESPANVSSHTAARLLGVSVGTVINMIDRGLLTAWRTAGGHRRVDMSSLNQHIIRQEALRELSVRKRMQVMVIEDEEFLRVAYQEVFADWALPIELKFAVNGIEALLEIGRSCPDVLIVDLRMPEIDGFAVIRTLREGRRYDSMDIVTITGLTGQQIEQEGGLPDGVTVWQKPIPFDQLRGFLDARLAAYARTRQRGTPPARTNRGGNLGAG